MTVSVLLLILAAPWVSLQCVIVVFLNELNELKTNIFELTQHCVKLSFQPIRSGYVGSKL